MNAYDQGYAARDAGVRRKGCPYVKTDLSRADWLRGWDDADAQASAAQDMVCGYE